jgi:SP family general alpha glucoside:H+ symporter-like MFS transporter
MSSITAYGASQIKGEWSFRVAFVMTFWVPTVLRLDRHSCLSRRCGMFKKDRIGDAKKSIIKLFGKEVDVEERLRFIRSGLLIEEGEAHNAKSTSCEAIFSQEHRSRILVAVLGLQSQNFSGSYFASTSFTPPPFSPPFK